MIDNAMEPLRFERVVPEAEPFWIDPGGTIGCLLIHGWLGTPAELRPLAERLAARGIACYGHRLPGHGTQPEDLAHVTSLEWQASVEAGLQHVRRRKQHVFVLGYAASGALALYLAAAHPEASWLRGVITISTPVRFDDLRVWLTPVLRWLLPWGRPRRIQGELDAQIAADHEHYLSYPRFPLRNLQQVCRLVRETRPRLHLVRAPLLVVHGKHDRLVHPDDAQIIYDQTAAEDRALLWLDESAHLAPLGPDGEELARVAAAFMQNRVPAAPEPPLRPVHPAPKEPHKLPALGLIRSTHKER